MATLTRTTLEEVGRNWTTAATGMTAGWQAVGGSGDLVPISSGRGTLIRFKTAGTACVVTIDSVLTSNYGEDENITISLGATDEKEVFIVNDGSGRFDQGGANAGLASVSYSATTNVSIAAKTIP